MAGSSGFWDWTLAIATPFTEKRALHPLPTYFENISISPEFGPGWGVGWGVGVREERDILQLPPADQFPLGYGNCEYQVWTVKARRDLGDHLWMRKPRPIDF